MKTEVWADVNIEEGLELYEVSNMGRVRGKEGEDRLRGGESKILKPYTYSNGYVRVRLYNRELGKCKNYSLHRLVMFAFSHEPLGEKFIVHHINSKKDDNRLINLQWSTQSANIKQAWKRDRDGYRDKMINNRLTAESVEKIRKMYEGGGHSYYTLADIFGVSMQHIGAIIRKDCWQ